MILKYSTTIQKKNFYAKLLKGTGNLLLKTQYYFFYYCLLSGLYSIGIKYVYNKIFFERKRRIAWDFQEENGRHFVRHFTIIHL